MIDARWELDIAPTAKETYEAMVTAGRASLGGKDRAILVFQSLFIGFCAPIGATMLLFIFVQLSGGPEFSDLPAFAIPVAFLLFGMLTLWLLRQAYLMVAKATVNSQFGRAQQVVLEQSGITLVTSKSRWHSGWGDVEAVCGAKNTLVICVSGVAFGLPRRAFLGPQDAEDALSVMRQWQSAA